MRALHSRRQLYERDSVMWFSPGEPRAGSHSTAKAGSKSPMSVTLQPPPPAQAPGDHKEPQSAPLCGFTPHALAVHGAGPS